MNLDAEEQEILEAFENDELVRVENVEAELAKHRQYTINLFTPEFLRHWKAIQPILTIRNEADYDRAIKYLNALIDEVGLDEKHPLYDLLDTLGTMILFYEEENEPFDL